MEGTCFDHIRQIANSSVGLPSDWSYGVCPDVQECLLGLHDCHPNATCVNTFDAYECHCNQGFTGDGKMFCNRT